MPFLPGQSGNPKGRPPKQRALTHLLEQAGKKKVDSGGASVQAVRVFAQKVWEGLTTGSLDFGPAADGTPRQIQLSGKEWVTLARLVMDQIDGPPLPTKIDPEPIARPIINLVVIPSRTSPPILVMDEHEIISGNNT